MIKSIFIRWRQLSIYPIPEITRLIMEASKGGPETSKGFLEIIEINRTEDTVTLVLITHITITAYLRRIKETGGTSHLKSLEQPTFC